MFVVELPKFPDQVTYEVKTSSDNRYTALLVNMHGPGVLTILDNETKLATTQLNFDTGGPSTMLVWIK